MKRPLLITLAAIAVVGTAGVLAANGGHHRGGMDGPGGMMGMPGMMHPGMIERVADELELTTEQRQTIKGYFDASKPKFDALRDRTRENAEKLMDLKPDDPKYTATVASVSKAAGEIASEMVTRASDLRSQVWLTLSPDQRTKLDALQTKMRERMEARMKEHQERRKARGQGATGSEDDGMDHDGPPPPPPPPPAK